MFGERPIGMRRLWVLITTLPHTSPLAVDMYPEDALWTLENRLLGLVAEILANVYRPKDSKPVFIIPREKRERPRQTMSDFLAAMGGAGGRVIVDKPAAPAAPAHGGPNGHLDAGATSNGGAAPGTGGADDSSAPTVSATETFPSDSDSVSSGGVVGVETPPPPATPEVE